MTCMRAGPQRRSDWRLLIQAVWDKFMLLPPGDHKWSAAMQNKRVPEDIHFVATSLLNVYRVVAHLLFGWRVIITVGCESNCLMETLKIPGLINGTASPWSGQRDSSGKVASVFRPVSLVWTNRTNIDQLVPISDIHPSIAESLLRSLGCLSSAQSLVRCSIYWETLMIVTEKHSHASIWSAAQAFFVFFINCRSYQKKTDWRWH